LVELPLGIPGRVGAGFGAASRRVEPLHRQGTQRNELQSAARAQHLLKQPRRALGRDQSALDLAHGLVDLGKLPAQRIALRAPRDERVLGRGLEALQRKNALLRIGELRGEAPLLGERRLERQQIQKNHGDEQHARKADRALAERERIEALGEPLELRLHCGFSTSLTASRVPRVNSRNGATGACFLSAGGSGRLISKRAQVWPASTCSSFSRWI